ncbi:GAP family protein [Lipingzhangella sp. LS1_29]|uniref:GAP family protein n=1 Tax=Lipingzhangella rawalii TaxID=2055835 RepID=A0ABU2H888_9ACTN|nr:GAP family protein [Lipingzhangella rawalii]MDS1270814.1 GAP family protein [Lipingzhangella rawalii]
MLDALTQLLPYVLGLVAAPTGIIATIVLLMASGGRVKAGAFTVAWAVAVLVVGLLVALLSAAASTGDTGPAAGTQVDWVAWVQTLLGLLLIVLALRILRRGLQRPADTEPEPPRWLAAMDGMTVPGAMRLALVLALLNPKNLAMIVGGGAVIGSFGLGLTAAAGATAVFAVLGSIGVLAPIVAVALRGGAGDEALRRARAWLDIHGDSVTMTVLFVFGGVFLAQGLGDLTG